MAVKSPIRYVFDGDGNIVEFSEFQAADFIGISDGGTGATTALGASQALGLEVGVDVQAYDINLDQLAALNPTDSNFIVGNGSEWVVESGSTVRDSLGLGTSDDVQFNTIITSNLTVNGPSIALEGATDDSFETTLLVTDPTADRTITFPDATGTVLLDSLAQTITNKTIDYDDNTIQDFELGAFKDSVIVTESEGIGSNDSDTQIATTAAIIDYVGAQLTLEDLDFAGDTGTGAVDLDSQSLTISGTANEIETSASGQTLTIGLPDDVTIGNSLTVTGNLTVQGSTTSVESNTVTIGDAILELNADETGAPSANAGLTVNRGTSTNVDLLWDEANDRWTVGSYDFVAANFIGDLTGTADVADALSSAVTVELTGDLSGSATFTNAGDTATISATIQPDSVALGTDTTGNYVEDITAGDGLSTTGTASEGQTPTLSVNVDDSSIEIDTDTLQVKALGITNAMLAGSIDNTKLTNSSVTINANALSLGGTLTLVTDDIAEDGSPTNLWYTDARVGTYLTTNSYATETYVDNAVATENEISEMNDVTLTSLSTGEFLQYNGSAWVNIDLDTDDIDEGSNLFYTTTRANTDIDARVTKSFVDALNVDADTLDGNDSTAFATAAQGTLADSALQSGDNVSELVNDANYIDLTDLSGGTGVTYDNTTGQISIGQSVGTTDNVTFNNVTVDGILNSDDITATTMTVSNDLVVTGDLTVQGTTTTLNTDTVSTEENMIKLASGNTGNSTDIGIYGKVVQSSTTKYVGLHWDPGVGQNKFKLFDSLTVEPTGTVDTADASYTKATLVANIEGDVTGALTGNADTATSLASAQNFSLTGDVTATAISFDGTGAVALSTTVTESAVTQHESALTITESQISDLQSYLTAETNDLTAAVTWANVPDANITQSSVTQHQAALAINESQITFTSNFLENLVEDTTPQLGGTLDANGNTIDMGVNVITDTKVGQWDTAYSWGDHSTAGYLTSFTETNDLTAAVTWANVPDANITESSVTQHEAALSITESQISDLGSYITATSSDTLTNKTINFEDNTAIIEFAVTVSNPGAGNKYYLDGELSANIQLIPGVTYRFDQSDSSNSTHPLVFSTTSESAGVTSYTTGVTQVGTPGSSGAYTQIVVDGATADKLYYYCSSHSGMGGGIVSIQGSSFVAGTGIDISGETISIDSTLITSQTVETTNDTNDLILIYDDSASALRKMSRASFLSGTGVGSMSSFNITDGSNTESIGDGNSITFSGTSNEIEVVVSPTDTVTIGLPSDVTIGNNLTVTGDLIVSGTTTTINTETIELADNIIVFNSNATGSASQDAGIEIERGDDANKTLIWNETDDKWTVGSETFVAGTFEGALTGDVTGNVTGDVTGDVDGAIILSGKNETGSTIGAGVPVYISGQASSGTEFTVAPADADGSGTMPAIGITTASTNNNAAVSILTFGKFVGLDTSSFSVGDSLYVSTSGTLVNTPPTGESALLQKIAKVTRSHASDGAIFVQGAGRSNAVPNLDDGDIFIGNASNQPVTASFNTTVDGYLSGGTGIDYTSGTISVDSTAITGQSALAGSVDTANDFVLLYDDSSTSLTKVDVATLLASAGSGSFNDFNLTADTGTPEVVADGNTVTIAGGTGIDTVVSTTDTVTVSIDNTVITTSSSIGDLSDVDITTSAPTDGQALVWNASNSEFEPGTVASSTNYFQTIAVSGQSDIVPDSTTDTLNFAAGANITLTTDASTDTVTIAATGGAANAFSTLAVAGQSNVVADAETDTLTLTAGTGMTITTDASTDTITFTSAGGGGGSLPVILAGSTSDPITLSDITVAGAIPFTSFDGTTDNIQLGSTQTAVTTFADNDADTSIELERTSDDDTVYIKAGGTDVVTATSSGVTITNLTVTGTTTQANELKITDTLFELNADGGSLTTDAGMIIERGSTGDNAAFIWDESADAFVVGTTATDGSAATNLTVTEATLKAATQTQGDNSTNVATTAYVDTALGSLSSNSITDADNDTKIQVEESSDEDIIRVDTAGQERLTIDNNVSMSARGGFFTHQLTMDSNETFTIASTEGTVAAGPLDIQGTVDVQGSLVVL
jgi:hypothetical protein